jgi:PAS domain S-box-containing protein
VRDRVIIDLNPRVYDMLGYKTDELIGKNARVFYETQSEYDRVGDDKYDQIAKYGTGIVETKWLKKDGIVIDVLLSSTPLNQSDLSFGVTFTALDITDRKKAEFEIIIAKEKAEESDKLKTAFLHNISHEIRTPMNAIVGFTALLDDNDLHQENRKQYIDIIYQSSNQLLSIISDIVDISNIETGQVKINISEININSTIINLFEQFIIRAKMQGLAMNYYLSLNDEEAKIDTDGTKLIQILTNLLNNAIKFTSEGEIVLGYTLKDYGIEFMVSDTGIGIPKDKHGRIFDRFYQVDNSISRQFGGTGLGLSICRAYARLLGGDIRVESTPGKGSVFYIILPYIKSEKHMEIMEIQQNKSEGFLSSKTILIAEDDDINFLVVEKTLKGNNLVLIRAENGAKAVDICKSNSNIDLVLLDLKMPVMDGLEAMKLIREFRPSLPFIALTAYAFESDKKHALEIGCSDYISKPFSKKELLEVIIKHL